MLGGRRNELLAQMDRCRAFHGSVPLGAQIKRGNA